MSNDPDPMKDAEHDDADGAATPETRRAEAAARALAEAAERRAATETAGTKEDAAPEIGGRDGPDPARYGDWEKKGVISDF